jgi:hypothetical protein
MLGELLEPKLLTEKPVIGYRGWYIKNVKEDGYELFPLNKQLDIPFNKDITKAILCRYDENTHFLEHECGLYSYYNYYYYYNNNNYYNYYNYYYYNNYNNYYNYNNYNNYYNYYVAGKIQHSGKIAHHKLGYRSTLGKPILLVKLTPKEELDKNFQKFLEHFNTVVQRTADYYGCETIYHEDFK